jgi:hypothetical protein
MARRGIHCVAQLNLVGVFLLAKDRSLCIGYQELHLDTRSQTRLIGATVLGGEVIAGRHGWQFGSVLGLCEMLCVG